MKKNSFPTATYRLQLNEEFTFKEAQKLLEFLNELGISHCYLSPILKARTGSKHGYDIIDHKQINPEIGTEEDFTNFVNQLKDFGMGLIIDIVPNHMCIAGGQNKWWQDILENGPSSIYADFFDIDWNPPREGLVNKVLLPFLEYQFGESLEKHHIKVNYSEGAFFIELSNKTLPTDPRTWDIILESSCQQVSKCLPSDHPDFLELQSILTAIKHLPLTTEKDKEKIAERYREKEVIKKRFKRLLEKNDLIFKLLQQDLENLNGKKEELHSFDLLEKFLISQPFRLSFWRVANDEINFRRFFDIFDYAGLRTENPQAFDNIHSLIFEWIHKGFVNGLRIDHIDGLWDPEKYLNDLQAYCLQDNVTTNENDRDRDALFFVIAEKILTGKEKLLPEWLLHGTVGYDFLNLVNGLFVAQNNKNAIFKIYRNFTNSNLTTFELIFFCKRLVLLVSLSSELHVLARHLDRISQKHRSSRDFTAESLRYALRDVIAGFPVYRTYIQAHLGKIHKEDEEYINAAIARAKRMNPAISASIFDFIQTVLLLKDPPGLDDQEKMERRDFVMKFQQLTGPVMAKGLEDTAFYRFYPLVSLNEVGTDPYGFGTSVEMFHKRNLERIEIWPHSMTSTSTHDTKRSEDVRARINVLSEIPHEWSESLLRWSKMNQKFKTIEGDDIVPDSNEEYLLYQTLIGSWPLYPMDISQHISYMNRILAYMEKAIKEAKINTSWINPNERWDKGVKDFVQKILNFNENEFLDDFKLFISKIAVAGMWNALSQIVLKFCVPGIPDIYQGNEVWSFTLVDPDNRTPIDYSNRIYLLNEIKDKTKEDLKSFAKNLLKNIEDGRIKLFVTMQLLNFRKQNTDLFSKGFYIPLIVQGEKSDHVIAFARKDENKSFLVIVGRFFSSLMESGSLTIDATTWKGTYVVIPEELNSSFKNIFTGDQLNFKKVDGQLLLEVDKAFDLFPFGCFEGCRDVS